MLEQCRRRNVTLQIVDGDIEIEFDRANPPHDLIEQLRVYKTEVVRSVRLSDGK